MNFSRTVILFIALSSALPAHGTRCPSGTFQTSNGTCQICPPGTWRNSRDSFLPRDAPCIPCRPGTFNPFAGAVGQDLCRRCPRNTFAASPGSSSCTACPPGKSSNFRAQSCLRCGPGTALARNSKRCEQCQEGFYSSQPTNNRCLPCPLVQTSPRGATSITQCTVCPPGQFAFRGPCEKCSRGQSKLEKTGQCNACRPGEFSDREGAIKCDLCPPGTFQKGLFGESCKPCRNGTTSIGFGNSRCREIGQPCTRRFFEDDKGDCRACQEGYRLNLVKTRCEKCPSGSVSPGGVQTICERCTNGQIPDRFNSFCGCPRGKLPDKKGGCKPCPPGEANPNTQPTGSTCFSCQPGTFSSKSGAIRCKRCPPGQIAPLNGATRCSSCPEGTITGIGRDERLLCVSKTTRCPLGFIRTFVGARDVFFGCRKVTCTLNSTEEEIGTACALCEPGTFLDNDRKRCRRCGFDEFSLGGLSTQCQKCPLGQVRDEFDGSKCSCRGFRAVGRGLQNGECVRCPAGSFSGFESELCEPCQRGTFANKRGMEFCRQCAIDFFSDKEGAKRCKKCARGTISDRRPGGISCIPSPV